MQQVQYGSPSVFPPLCLLSQGGRCLKNANQFLSMTICPSHKKRKGDLHCNGLFSQMTGFPVIKNVGVQKPEFETQRHGVLHPPVAPSGEASHAMLQNTWLNGRVLEMLTGSNGLKTIFWQIQIQCTDLCPTTFHGINQRGVGNKYFSPTMM